MKYQIHKKQNYKKTLGDITAQKEILDIYIKCAESMIEQDEKMLAYLLKKGRISQEMYDQLVLKDVIVGTGNNDLGILENAGLSVVPEEEMILPRQQDLKKYHPWIDSGVDSLTGEGAQLYLARSGKKRIKGNYDLEDLPLLYANEREVRNLKGSQIDDNVIEQIRKIESTTYRGPQQLLQYCRNYKHMAEIYDITPEQLQVSISRENDWYMVYEERKNEAYIADLAMINGLNSERNQQTKTEVLDQVIEMTESIYSFMLNMAKKGKTIRFEATEDTSYNNIMRMVKKGLANVLEEEVHKWEDDDEPENLYSATNNPENQEIIIHDMVISINKEKMEDELKRVRELLAKRKEKRKYRKADEESR